MERGTVLVTGAAGFIGVHLVKHLSSQGHNVRALDLHERPPQLIDGRISYHQADVRDDHRLQELLAGVDTAFHLASVHLEVGQSEAAFHEVNVGASGRLVSLCAAAGVRRLVHTSSVGIYGHVEYPPANENSPKHPQTPYERTKLAGEEAVLQSAHEVGLDVVILRPAWVYGPGCPRTAKLLRSLRKRRFFYVGAGANLRHPLFIDDMSDAYLRAAAAPADVAGRSYVIAGPRSMTLREMVDTFAAASGVTPPRLRVPRSVGRGLALAAELTFRIAGREPPFSRRSLAFFENDNAFDTSAAERDLGFRAKVDLEEGLQRTLALSEQPAAA